MFTVLLCPAVTVEGSSRSWIWVSGPTELSPSVPIPSVRLIVPPATRLRFIRLIILMTLPPMPLRLC